MIRINQDYEDYFLGLAKIWGAAGGVTITPFEKMGVITVNGVDDKFYDLTQPAPAANVANPPLPWFLFGTLLCNLEIASAAANGFVAASLNEQIMGTCPVTSRTIAVGVPDVGTSPALEKFAEFSFAWMRVRQTGAANASNFNYKFIGIKVSWGA